MSIRTVTASGDTKWDWPCLHLNADERVEAVVYWTTEAGDTYELPADDVSAGSLTVTVLCIPGEGATSLLHTFSSASVQGNALVLSDEDVSEMSGCYRAQARFTDSDNKVRFSLPFLLSIAADPFSATAVKAVTLEDVRMFLMDRMASENVIQGGQEFSDRLIFDAMCQAVRMYNQSPPLTDTRTVRTMPPLENFHDGIASHVFRAKAALLHRNRLAVAGQADAEQRANLYTELANMYRTRYLSWVSETKRVLDAGDGWGVA